jgi:hypothetical protein
MSDDDFNMSMRKFLKQVGVTSQQQIEEAVRAAREAGTAPGEVRLRMVLTCEDIDLQHEVTGTIKTGGAA